MTFPSLNICTTLGIAVIINISELVSCTHCGQCPLLHAEIPTFVEWEMHLEKEKSYMWKHK